MTAPADTRPIPHQWLSALPEDIRRQVNATVALGQHIVAAHTRGWTVQQLADEAARDHHTSHRVAAVVTARMERAAQMPPPRPVSTLATFKQPLEWCRQCSDPITRWTNDLPARRCTCWTDPRSAT